MSKVDAQRAMREAKYARNRLNAPTEKSAPSEGEAAPAAARPVRKPAPEPVRAARPAATEAEPASGLCGHKSMNGRACTREAAHPEKSHRYG